jgi:hypothetical protein
MPISAGLGLIGRRLTIIIVTSLIKFSTAITFSYD